MSLQDIVHWLYGFDLFVSYRHKASSPYAEELKRRLQSGRSALQVFLDRSEDGFTSGTTLSADTRRAIRSSTALVVLVERSVFAADSNHVPVEVAGFNERGKLIIPVDLDGCLERSRTDPDFRQSLAVGDAGRVMLDTLLERLAVSDVYRGGSTPSAEVESKLRLACQSMTRTARRVGVILGTAMLILTLFGALATGTMMLRSSNEYARLQEDFSKQNQLTSQLRAAIESRQPVHGLKIASQALELQASNSKLTGGAEIGQLLARLVSAEIPKEIQGFTQIADVAVNRDASLVAITGKLTELGQEVLHVIAPGSERPRAAVQGDYGYTAVAFSPDGGQVACAVIVRDSASGSYLFEARIYSQELRNPSVFRIPPTFVTSRYGALFGKPADKDRYYPYQIDVLNFTPDGRFLVLAGAASPSEAVSIPHHWRSWIDLKTGQVFTVVDAEHELGHFSSYRAIAAIGKSSFLLSDGFSEVYFDDFGSGERKLIGHHPRKSDSGVTDIAIAPSANRAAAVGSDNSVTVFTKKQNSWAAKREVLPGTAQATRVAWLDEYNLIVARADYSLTLASLRGETHFDGLSQNIDGEIFVPLSKFISLTGHGGRINAIAVSPSGDWFATASEDMTVRVWGIRAYDSRVLVGSMRAIRRLRISADGTSIVAASLDGKVHIWPARRAEGGPLVSEPRHLIPEVLISDEEWDEGGGMTRAFRREHRGFVRDLRTSPDGRYVAAMSYGGLASIWKADGELVKAILVTRQGESGSRKFTFSGDSRWILTTGSSLDGYRIDGEESFSVKTEKWPVTLDIHGQWAAVDDGKMQLTLRSASLGIDATRVAVGVFSKDGSWFASANGNELRVWNTSRLGAPARVLEVPDGFYPESLRFADSAPIVVALIGDDPVSRKVKGLLYLDLATGQVRRLTGANIVQYFSMSRDGRCVAIAGLYGEIYLWRSVDLPPVVLLRHARYVSTVDLSPDGKWLVSGSRDRTVRLWSTETEAYAEFPFLNPIESVLVDERSQRIWIATGTALHGRWYPSAPVKDLLSKVRSY
jgi:WD40 repeat protein